MKRTKESVHYTAKAQNRYEICGKCIHHVPHMARDRGVHLTCDKVRGSVALGGWCELWKPFP